MSASASERRSNVDFPDPEAPDDEMGMAGRAGTELVRVLRRVVGVLGVAFVLVAAVRGRRLPSVGARCRVLVMVVAESARRAKPVVTVASTEALRVTRVLDVLATLRRDGAFGRRSGVHAGVWTVAPMSCTPTRAWPSMTNEQEFAHCCLGTAESLAARERFDSPLATSGERSMRRAVMVSVERRRRGPT